MVVLVVVEVDEHERCKDAVKAPASLLTMTLCFVSIFSVKFLFHPSGP